MASSHFFHVTTFSITLIISLICFFLLPSNVAAATNAADTDRLALLSFKSLIWGDPSGALSSWNSSLHHCLWQGVSCGRRHPDRVTALALDTFQLAGQISPSLGNLTFLQNLNLSLNRLSGNIPQELGHLSRLECINLDFNFLHGSIPSSLFNNCSNLQDISVWNNNLGGTIPSSLVRCQNLRGLHLTNNFLTGSIPPDLGNLPKLKYLSLGINNLTGHIPPALGNLTNLLALNLYTNTLTGSIPASLGKLHHLFYFIIHDNQISGSVPRSLYNLSNLDTLDLSRNYLEDFLPLEMCDTFQALTFFSIYQNHFYGKIPSSLSNCTTLQIIQIDTNNFTGTVPTSIGRLKKLNILMLGRNQLEAKTSSDWNFVHALINCTDLEGLDIRNNKFQGVIPRSFANLSSLQHLILSGNPISGSIPAEFGMLTNLKILGIYRTLLTGKIPVEIGNLWNLQLLNFWGNMLSGEIPSTFGNLTKMSRLFLYNNALEGCIPPSLGNMQSLLELDISNNVLVGEIPKEIINIRTLFNVYLSNNNLNGSIPQEIEKWNNIVLIDLSYNNLSGLISSTIDNCQLLQFLYLGGNLLHGPIPSSLSNLKGLQELDLSNNSFSGTIPSFFGSMNLSSLNISFNDFQGELPQGGVFKNMTAVDVRANPKLCGGLPDYQLAKCISGSPAHKHLSQTIKIILVCIAAGLLCIFMIMYFLIGSYWRNRSKKDLEVAMAIAVEFEKVSYNDLYRATNSFSLNNLIGSGTFGVVYKAEMSIGGGTPVAVKVLNLEQHGAVRSFMSECEALRNVRHRNLIKILSVCSSIDHQGNDFKALIYKLMPNGSLETWLHPNSCKDRPFKSLTLIQRMNIAVDVAMALDYLHNHKPESIIHCDLKPSNVLLDEDMTAHVSDFGLARFLVQADVMPDQSTTSTTGIKGSIGYIPPEYGMGGRVSMQGDVYSYGVLLLEMFTGKSPTDERFEEGLSLRNHVETACPGRVMDIIDRKLFMLDNGDDSTSMVPDCSLDCLVSVIQCGLQCSMESAKDRIAISDVVKALDSARNMLQM